MQKCEVLEFFMEESIKNKINDYIDKISIAISNKETIDLIKSIIESDKAASVTIQAFWLDWKRNRVAFYLDCPSPLLVFSSQMKGNIPVIYDFRSVHDKYVLERYEHNYKTMIHGTIRIYSNVITSLSSRGVIQEILTSREGRQRNQLDGRIKPSTDYLDIALERVKARRFRFQSRQCKLISSGTLEITLKEEDSKKYNSRIQECMEQEKKLIVVTTKEYNGNEKEEISYPAVIEQWKSEQNVMILSVDPAEAIPDSDLRKLKPQTLIVYDRTSDLFIQKQAFKTLSFELKLLHNLPLDILLFGENEEVLQAIKPITEDEIDKVILYPYLRTDLNEEQRRAIKVALTTPEFFMLQGPPGTGKTTFIAELCYQIAKRGGSVLLSSQANFAVDNALSRLEQHPDILACRFGNTQRMHESGLKFVKGKGVQRWLHSLAPEVQKEIKRLQNTLKIHHILDTNWDEIYQQYSLYEEYQQALVKSQKEIETTETFDHETKKQFDDIECLKTKQYLRDRWCELRPLVSEFSKYIPVEQDGLISFADMQLLKEVWIQQEGDEWEQRSLEQRIVILQDWYELLEKSQDDFEVPDPIWEIFLRQANVFGATCAYSGSPGFLDKIVKIRKKQFDYVIIDEVSKVTANDLVIPALSGKKLILVGDHKQLPSMWKEETQEGIQEAMKLYGIPDELIQLTFGQNPTKRWAMLPEAV